LPAAAGPALPEGKRWSILRTYESIIIFHPEASEESRREVQDKVRGAIERGGGEVQAMDDWGKRKLAYAVHKNRYGQMVRFQLQGQSSIVGELDLVFRHAEQVIKYMTVLLTEKFLKRKAADALLPVALETPDNGRRGRR
jgi:small subunit ribosomal protein S6